MSEEYQEKKTSWFIHLMMMVSVFFIANMYFDGKLLEVVHPYLNMAYSMASSHTEGLDLNLNLEFLEGVL